MRGAQNTQSVMPCKGAMNSSYLCANVTTNSKLKDLPSRIALRLLRTFAGRRQGLPLLSPAELRRVLLVRYDRLGDLVVTTPVIDAIRMIAPQAEIDLLASNANRSLVESDPRISHIWIWSDSLIDRLRVVRACRRRRYDAVFQLLYSRTTLPAILAGLLAPHGRTIGKFTTGHGFLFNHAVDVPSGHYKEKTLALVEGGLALERPLPDLPYAIQIPETERKHAEEMIVKAGLERDRFVMINISAGKEDRELAHEQNVEIARRLAAHGHRVAIIGAPSAADRIEAIAADADATPLRFRSLLALVAAMERASLVITPDTGTLHIAAAAGAPVLGMYAVVGDPPGWGPRGVPFVIIRSNADPMRRGISIDEVVDGAVRLLAMGKEGGERDLSP